MWECTDVGSPLRILFLRLVMCGDVMDAERFDETPEHFPREFLLEFAKFSKMEDFGEDWHMSCGDFHLGIPGDSFGSEENVPGNDFGCGMKR